MRLPKRIADIIKRKDDFITAREASLNKSVVRLQNMLISKLTREIIPMLDTANGRIKNTLRNYQLLQSLDRVYTDFIPRNCDIKRLGANGTSNVCHRKSLGVLWGHRGYAHNHYFNQKLLDLDLLRMLVM